MLTLDSRFRSNDGECAAKVIDGEAVIINLQNGTYYSLDKAGAAVWEQVADGRTLADVIETLKARYEVDAERAQNDVQRLVGELLTERLLFVANGDLPAPASIASSSGGAAPESRLPYEEPVLTTYRDMADLLALDPPMPRLEDVVWSEPGSTSSNADAA